MYSFTLLAFLATAQVGFAFPSSQLYRRTPHDETCPVADTHRRIINHHPFYDPVHRQGTLVGLSVHAEKLCPGETFSKEAKALGSVWAKIVAKKASHGSLSKRGPEDDTAEFEKALEGFDYEGELTHDQEEAVQSLDKVLDAIKKSKQPHSNEQSHRRSQYGTIAARTGKGKGNDIAPANVGQGQNVHPSQLEAGQNNELATTTSSATVATSAGSQLLTSWEKTMTGLSGHRQKFKGMSNMEKLDALLGLFFSFIYAGIQGCTAYVQISHQEPILYCLALNFLASIIVFMEGVAATFHATKPTTTPQATVSMEEFSSLKTEVAELREMFVPVKQAAITLTASIDGNGKEKEIDPERLAEAINVFRQISQSQPPKSLSIGDGSSSSLGVGPSGKGDEPSSQTGYDNLQVPDSNLNADGSSLKAPSVAVSEKSGKSSTGESRFKRPT